MKNEGRVSTPPFLLERKKSLLTTKNTKATKKFGLATQKPSDVFGHWCLPANKFSCFIFLVPERRISAYAVDNSQPNSVAIRVKL